MDPVTAFGFSFHWGLSSTHTGGLSLLPSNIWMVNITTYVSVTPTTVDDYLSWHTQFSSFVIMHQISGIIDGMIPYPSPVLSYTDGL